MPTLPSRPHRLPPLPTRPAAAMLTLACLPGVARAEVDLETIAQVRRDLFGQVQVPWWELVRFEEDAGGLSVLGYGALGDPLGRTGGLQPDLYLLSASHAGSRGDWSAGRLDVQGSLYAQTLDGVAGRVRAGRSLQVEGHVGVARHQDLDDFLDGTGLGRLGIAWSGGGVRARVGVQAEGGMGTALLARQDAEAAWSSTSRIRPAMRGRVVVAEPTGSDSSSGNGSAVVPEWLEVEVAASPVPALRAAVQGRHRETADPTSLFGDAILATFARSAVDEAGLRLSWMGPRWAVLSGRAAWVTYDIVDDRADGFAADLAWTSPRGDGRIAVTPSWTFRTGPGGAFHAISASEDLHLSDRAGLRLTQGVVPFHKEGSPWETAASAGAEARVQVGSRLSTRLGGDLAANALAVLDWRVGASLTVEIP